MKTIGNDDPTKKKIMLPLTRCKHCKNWVEYGRDFFFFFYVPCRELSFPIFFLKFLNGENSGGMQSKRIYKSCKCFFKPLNTKFSKFFAQIWHKKKKKTTLFFRILRSVGRGQHNKTKNLGLMMIPELPSHAYTVSLNTAGSTGKRTDFILVTTITTTSIIHTNYKAPNPLCKVL